jgi:hypothetical protein
MERPAYNNFPKNRNGPGYGGQNQECRDASRRIICKLRGERYRNQASFTAVNATQLIDAFAMVLLG